MYQGFNDIEMILIRSKIGQENQALFATLLYNYKTMLRFPGQNERLDPYIIERIYCDLSIQHQTETQSIIGSRSIRRFKKDIRYALNFKKHSKKSIDHFIIYLVEDLLPWVMNAEQIMQAVFEYHREHKIEIQVSSKLQQTLEIANKRFEAHLFNTIYSTMNDSDRRFIDKLTNFGQCTDNEKLQDEVTMELDLLKQGIPGIRLKNVSDSIKKYQEVSKIVIPEAIISKYSRKVLMRYSEKVMSYYPSNINDLSKQSRYAIVAIFCHIRKETLADNLIELFSMLLVRIKNRSKNFVKGTLVNEIKKVEGKFKILLKLTSISLEKPDGIIKNTIYPEVSKELLEDLEADLTYRGQWYKNQVRNKMCSLFSIGNRKEILDLLSLFEFKSDDEDKSLLAAINYIKTNKDCKDPYDLESIPLTAVIPNSWLDFVINTSGKNQKLNKYNYELVVCNEVRKKLAYKGVWAEGAYRYRSPKRDIPDYILRNQQKFIEEIGLITEDTFFISSLKKSLDHALQDLNDSIKSNEKVSIKNNGHIKITPFIAQIAPENVSCIHHEILKRWGNINLLDAFKEASFRIGFTKRFISVGKYSSISGDTLIMRLLLCLYAIGSNTGLKRISSANPYINESDLRYIKRRFINASNIRLAIVDVVNKVIKIRDPKIWGEATTSVACDSKKIAAWDQNLLTQWHPRYKGNGIMVYWHVDTNALCVYSQSKICNSSEVGTMIKGILDHSTKMDMDAAYVDTHGQSTIGFGVSKLLNFNIFPRLKNISRQKLYVVSMNDKTKLHNISSIIKDAIKWKDIERGYKDSIPYIIALKKGAIEADVFVKRFSKDNYKDPVYKALCEIGKVEKTIFLCRYLSDEKFRIEINSALNVVERLNSVMNFFFYGKVSGISSNDPDEQELSILSLQLLQVCAVYINTLLIQEVFLDLSLHNTFKQEDYRALSPLICSHFNPYGIFILNLKDRLVINRRSR